MLFSIKAALICTSIHSVLGLCFPCIHTSGQLWIFLPIVSSFLMLSGQWVILLTRDGYLVLSLFHCLDCVSIGVCPHTELHRLRSMVCHLSPFDVQEHSQEGPQQYRHHLDCVLHHNDSSGHRHGVQYHAPWLSQQNDSLYSLWWALGRWVYCRLQACISMTAINWKSILHCHNKSGYIQLIGIFNRAAKVQKTKLKNKLMSFGKTTWIHFQFSYFSYSQWKGEFRLQSGFSYVSFS